MKSKIVLFFTIILSFLLQSTLTPEDRHWLDHSESSVDSMCFHGADAGT